MSTIDGLMQAILSAPDDDSLRLIMADRLDEAGDHDRSSFVRIQCRLAVLPGCQVEGKVVNWQSPMRACRDVFPDPHDGNGWGPHCDPCREFVRLRRRQDELFKDSGPRWWNDLPGDYRATVTAGTSIETANGWKYLVRRGFVSEFHGRLSHWCGDKCQRCDGDGLAHGSDRPFEWSPEVGYPGPCPVCGGAGTLSAHGPTIVRMQPVTKVVLDREPWGCGEGWEWYSDERHNPSVVHPESNLPRAVFGLLEGFDKTDGRMKCWAVEDDAVLALSAAAIRWAKEQPH
jgi:uncharacterized protein (TIGR02996 family)